MPRIAIYAQDGYGLGHLRRTTLIGRRLLEESPGGSVLLFADSPVAPFFELPRGMDCVKLPSMQKTKPGEWLPSSLPLPAAQIRQLRAGILAQALQDYDPDLFLVDHMPGGVQGELIPALTALRERKQSCSIVLGLRDILDAPEVTMRVWQEEGTHEVIRQFYDRLLVYGNREVFDTAGVYGLTAPATGIRYCGYVANDLPPQSSSYVRPNGPEQYFVYVCAGGGADGYQLMLTYLRALRMLRGEVSIATVMAVGVNAPPEARLELIDEACDLPVQIVSHLHDSISVIAASDLVVCMAGYNTLSEVVHLRKKSLVVPRSGPSAEQTMRATLFQGRGLVDTVSPSALTPEHLARRIAENLVRNDYPAHDRVLNTSGVVRAASFLGEMNEFRMYGRG